MSEVSSSSKKRRNVFLLCGIALVVVVLVYVFFLSRVFVRRNDPLPYIWPNDLNFSLWSYISTRPSRHIDVISGGYKTGKSAALLNLTNELRRKNWLVYNFDFRKVKSQSDAVGFARLAVLEAANFFSASAATKSAARASRKVNELAEKLDFNNTYSIVKFFDEIEEINKEYDVDVAVMVMSVDRLRLHAPQIYEAGYGRLANRGKYYDNVPVIVESSDSSFRLNYFPPFFRVYEVDEIEDPYNVLYTKLHAFTSAELKKIKNAIGFQGGAVDNIFEEVRKAVPIDSAIEKEVERISNKVQSLMTNGTVYQKICDSKEKPILVNQDELYQVEPLIRKGFLYINGEYKLRTANHAVWKSLCA